ncbi:MAG: hypothetical protein JO250_09040 [Armatimonadetes bacterium]|nr:hypothetical protein [Armatimonadota bacterium]
MNAQQKTEQINLDDPEPRWPAVVALVAVGGLYEALPKSLQWGPRGLLISLVVLLIIPTVLTRRRGHHGLNRILGLSVDVVVTAFLIVSLGLLVRALLGGHIQPAQLLRSSAALWLTNVLVFALWYWQFDGGGPHQRDLRGEHTDGAFLFPQMAMSSQIKRETGEQGWDPNFLDYLFLAFNTSTALSPTDTAVLSRWAKVLMMLQALISLTVIVLLAARAVNILNPS